MDLATLLGTLVTILDRCHATLAGTILLFFTGSFCGLSFGKHLRHACALCWQLPDSSAACFKLFADFLSAAFYTLGSMVGGLLCLCCHPAYVLLPQMPSL